MAEDTVNTKVNYLKEHKVTARLVFLEVFLQNLVIWHAKQYIPFWERAQNHQIFQIWNITKPSETQSNTTFSYLVKLATTPRDFKKKK